MEEQVLVAQVATLELSGGGSISTYIKGEGGVVVMFVVCIDVICKISEMSMYEN